MDHTFVILAYQESPFLERCIQSLQAQTIPSMLHITTSTPNSFVADLARRYNIQVMVNPDGGSIGKDWNFGFRSASTPYVTLAHQDDEYLPEFAETCLRELKKNSAARPLMAFNRGAVRKGDNPPTWSYKNVLRLILIFPFHFQHCISSLFLKRIILLFSNSISCPGVVYGKENLQSFQFHPSARYVLDWKAWYEMSQRQGAFVYIPKILHIHREHADSATGRINREALQREEYNLLVKIWGNAFIAKLITRLLRLAK